MKLERHSRTVYDDTDTKFCSIRLDHPTTDKLPDISLLQR